MSQPLEGGLPVSLLGPGLGRDRRKAAGDMGDSDRRAGFVAFLASGPGSAKSLNAAIGQKLLV